MSTQTILSTLAYRKVDNRVYIHNLEAGEPLPSLPSPDGSPLGLDLLPLDPEWVWIAEHNDVPVGFLVGGNLHGLFTILRIIVVSPSHSPTLPLLLLRRAFSDAKRRGCLGYITILSDEREAEVKLMRIASRNNDTLIPHRGAWVIGKL